MPHSIGLVMEAYPLGGFNNHIASEQVYESLLTNNNNWKMRRSEDAARKDMKVMNDDGVEHGIKSEDNGKGCQERVPTGIPCYQEWDGTHSIERARWSSVSVYWTWSLPQWNACVAESCRSRPGVIASEQKTFASRSSRSSRTKSEFQSTRIGPVTIWPFAGWIFPTSYGLSVLAKKKTANVSLTVLDSPRSPAILMAPSHISPPFPRTISPQHAVPILHILQKNGARLF